MITHARFTEYIEHWKNENCGFQRMCVCEREREKEQYWIGRRGLWITKQREQSRAGLVESDDYIQSLGSTIASLDSSTAPIDSSTAQIDSSTAPIDISTALFLPFFSSTLTHKTEQDTN